MIAEYNFDILLVDIVYIQFIIRTEYKVQMILLVTGLRYISIISQANTVIRCKEICLY